MVLDCGIISTEQRSPRVPSKHTRHLHHLESSVSDVRGAWTDLRRRTDQYSL